jgi:hypothetical protein
MELIVLPMRMFAIALLVASCSASGPSASSPAPAPAPSSQPASPAAQPEAPATASSAPSAPTEPDAGPSAPAVTPAGPPPPLPTGTTVLHIGDSMAGALGVALNEELKKAGLKGVLRFKTASFIPTWAWSKDLPVLLAHHNPDLILITLGANEVAIKDPEIRAGTVRKLVGRLEGRPCVWIAPPLWAAGDTGLLPVIRKNAAPCRFMDTNAIVKDMPRLDDKIHPTIGARKEWAKTVLDWLARERKPDGARPWELKSEP